MLDSGAGAGIVKQMNFRGLGAEVSGTEPDPRVLENPMLDVARMAWAEEIPFADGSFDLVFADNVLEHLQNPGAVFREVFRVLKPGGKFVFKTPNKWHYMPLIARATPHAFHRFYNRLRGREGIDTFPTAYRANSRADLTELGRISGLSIFSVDLIEGRPEYLRISPVTYVFGYLYERLVNSTRIFDGVRILIIGVLSRPNDAGHRAGAPSDQ
ncbi:MAG: class I SAM-dependent methyltransferase [Proteobacteria bacterium]|nr:class I SAM-dependent methyltransferase [Pseudomonadota bacterium]